MQYKFGNILDTLKEAVVYESDVALEKKPPQIIFHGFGIEHIPGLVLESIIPNSKAICSEKLPEDTPKEELIVIFSFEGYEDSQDFYRSCIRNGNEVIFLSKSKKIKELCKVNKSTFIELNDIKHKELIFLHEIISFINIAINNNLCEKFELKELIFTIANINFDSLIQQFKEKINDKKIAFISTTKASNIANAWRIFFNNIAREEPLFEIFPNVIYYNLENIIKKDAAIFFINDEESSLTKRKVKHTRESLTIQSTELLIKGSNALYKALIPTILGFLISVDMFYDKNPNGNPFKSDIFDSFMRNKRF